MRPCITSQRVLIMHIIHFLHFSFINTHSSNTSILEILPRKRHKGDVMLIIIGCQFRWYDIILIVFIIRYRDICPWHPPVTSARDIVAQDRDDRRDTLPNRCHSHRRHRRREQQQRHVVKSVTIGISSKPTVLWEKSVTQSSSRSLIAFSGLQIKLQTTSAAPVPILNIRMSLLCARHSVQRAKVR